MPDNSVLIKSTILESNEQETNNEVDGNLPDHTPINSHAGYANVQFFHRLKRLYHTLNMNLTIHSDLISFFL